MELSEKTLTSLLPIVCSLDICGEGSKGEM